MADASYAASLSPWGLLTPLLPGAAQGLTTVFLGHPLDTAKTRMQAVGPNAQRSVAATMFAMARQESLRSWYRGLMPPLVMEGTKRSLQLALWDLLRRTSNEPTTAQGPSASTTTMQRSNNPFVAGAVAGGAGTILGCPMNVIKIQTQYSTERTMRNAWSCVRQIWCLEGLRGFYRGIVSNLLKDVTFAGSYLGLYAVLQQRLEVVASARGTPASSSLVAFVSGAVASMATWTLLYPIDTIKTLVQTRQSHRIWPIMVREPRSMYRGWSASMIKAGPVAGASMMAYDATWRWLHH